MVCFLLLCHIFCFPAAFNVVCFDPTHVEVERIDIGEPENIGMRDMVRSFL